MNNNLKNINKLYDNMSYMDLYGGSIVVSILLILAFFVLFSYFHIKKQFYKIKRNWNVNKCSPSVIPFAGLINKDPHKSVLDSTGANFNECVNNVLVEITGDFLSPIYYVTSTLQNMVANISSDIQMVRTKISSMVGNIGNIDKIIMGRIFGFIMPIKLMFIKIKDMLAKTNATLITTMYTGIATYLGLKSFISTFAILMLIPLAFCIVTAAILNAFFFTAPFAIPFEAAAAIIGAVLVFVAALELEIKHKEKN